jgi:hypothetical protein
VIKIKFKDLKEISENGDDYLIDYLNQFSGDNIYEKLLSVLTCWERDVSYEMGFNVKEKNVKVSLSYFIKEFENWDKEPLIIKTDNLEFELDVPPLFKKDYDIFSISETIRKVKYGESVLDFVNVGDKTSLIEQLPASTYNILINAILKNKSKTIFFINSSLKNISINFMGNAPFNLLKGLCHPYGEDYYRDVIYHLSSKIDGNILLNSTMRDIDYYVDKLNTENTSEKKSELG